MNDMNETHTDIATAIDECATGLHVSHVTNKRSGRIVAFRPSTKPHRRSTDRAVEYLVGKFDLDFSDPHIDLRDEPEGGAIYNVTRRRAMRLVDTFLRGIYLHDVDDGFAYPINQAERWCYLTPEQTPTKVRVNYDMPNAGVVGAWWYRTQVGAYSYLLQI